jgi:hypothetical protein
MLWLDDRADQEVVRRVPCRSLGTKNDIFHLCCRGSAGEVQENAVNASRVVPDRHCFPSSFLRL